MLQQSFVFYKVESAVKLCESYRLSKHALILNDEGMLIRSVHSNMFSSLYILITNFQQVEYDKII